MTPSIPPTTSTLSYFDVMSNEWVTTFTIRHKLNSEQNTNNAAFSTLMENLNKSAAEINLLCPKFELPTLNQKDISYIP